VNLDPTNIVWILAFGALLGAIAAVELRGRPAIRTQVLILTAILGMVIGDIAAGQVLGVAPTSLSWIGHPLQLVAAGLALAIVILVARRIENARARRQALPPVEVRAEEELALTQEPVLV
jgi:DNA-binding transcriptional regulator YdaS (Cro superfamily)